MSTNRAHLSDATVAPEEFRRVLGRVPTSVAVVSAAAGAGPVGMTVGSLTSVSLDPPLVAFFVQRGSPTLEDVRAAGMFCVNVLGQDQGEICQRFASSRRRGNAPGASADALWAADDGRPPRLREALAWLDCTVESLFDAGDHLGVMGRVRELSDAPGPTNPLIFYRGSLCRLHPASARRHETHPLQWWSL